MGVMGITSPTSGVVYAAQSKAPSLGVLDAREWTVDCVSSYVLLDGEAKATRLQREGFREPQNEYSWDEIASILLRLEFFHHPPQQRP